MNFLRTSFTKFYSTHHLHDTKKIFNQLALEIDLNSRMPIVLRVLINFIMENSAKMFSS